MEEEKLPVEQVKPKPRSKPKPKVKLIPNILYVEYTNMVTDVLLEGEPMSAIDIGEILDKPFVPIFSNGVWFFIDAEYHNNPDKKYKFLYNYKASEVANFDIYGNCVIAESMSITKEFFINEDVLKAIDKLSVDAKMSMVKQENFELKIREYIQADSVTVEFDIDELEGDNANQIYYDSIELIFGLGKRNIDSKLIGFLVYIDNRNRGHVISDVLDRIIYLDKLYRWIIEKDIFHEKVDQIISLKDELISKL